MKYETIIVFGQTLGEAQVKDESAKIETLIRNEGGQNVTLDFWGKRELAYLVRKNSFGHFVTFKYESEKSTTVANVTSVLRITEAVIKFQTHRIADKVRKFKGNPKRRPVDSSDDYLDGTDDGMFA